MDRKSVSWVGKIGCLAAAAIVVGIVYPVLTQPSHERTPPSSCMSNLRQIGLGIMQYVQDNDELLPLLDDPKRSATWKANIFPYIKSKTVFQCPAREDQQVGTDGLPISYAANTAGVGKVTKDRGPFAPSVKPIGLALIDDSTQLIAVCEVQKTASPGFDIDDPFFGPRRQVLYAGHRHLSNYLLLDGHVKALLPGDTFKSVGKDHSKLMNLWYVDGTKPLSSNGQQILVTTTKAFADSKD